MNKLLPILLVVMLSGCGGNSTDSSTGKNINYLCEYRDVKDGEVASTNLKLKHSFTNDKLNGMKIFYKEDEFNFRFFDYTDKGLWKAMHIGSQGTISTIWDNRFKVLKLYGCNPLDNTVCKNHDILIDIGAFREFYCKSTDE